MDACLSLFICALRKEKEKKRAPRRRMLAPLSSFMHHATRGFSSLRSFSSGQRSFDIYNNYIYSSLPPPSPQFALFFFLVLLVCKTTSNVFFRFSSLCFSFISRRWFFSFPFASLAFVIFCFLLSKKNSPSLSNSVCICAVLQEKKIAWLLPFSLMLASEFRCWFFFFLHLRCLVRLRYSATLPFFFSSPSVFLSWRREEKFEREEGRCSASRCVWQQNSPHNEEVMRYFFFFMCVCVCVYGGCSAWASFPHPSLPPALHLLYVN